MVADVLGRKKRTRTKVENELMAKSIVAATLAPNHLAYGPKHEEINDLLDEWEAMDD